MIKKEKIPEALTAIIDDRIKIYDTYAIVKSSDLSKEYLVKWNDNTYYSNDNATYWQGYMGYPVIGVILTKNIIDYNKDILKYFKDINWNKLNKETKRDYQKSFEIVISDLDDDTKTIINKEIDNIYDKLNKLDIKLTRKKNL